MDRKKCCALTTGVLRPNGDFSTGLELVELTSSAMRQQGIQFLLRATRQGVATMSVILSLYGRASSN
jgi:hypothetical protein